MIYAPKNSRFNREANLLGKAVWLIEKKSGTAHFVVVEMEGKHIFCCCEESLFDKEFSPDFDTNKPLEIEVPEIGSEEFNKIKFIRYPKDLKNRS